MTKIMNTSNKEETKRKLCDHIMERGLRDGVGIEIDFYGAVVDSCCSRCPRRRRAVGVLPSPRPPRNPVTPVVMRPMIVTNNQLGWRAGEEGDKGEHYYFIFCFIFFCFPSI